MHILYIYNSEEDRPYEVTEGERVALYRMGFGELIGEGIEEINDSQRLNDEARESAAEYSEFIYKQNERFIKGGLHLENKLSLYFITDLACKRTEQFPTYSDYCNARLIEEYLKLQRVDKIVMDGCRRPFVQAIKSVSDGIACVVKNEIVTKRRVLLAMIKNALFFLKVVLGVTARRIFLRLKKTRMKKGEIGRLFLTRFPLHLDLDLREEKYGDLVGDDGVYLVNLFTDNFHQRTGIHSYLQATKDLFPSERVKILDDYLSPIDAFKAFLFMLSLITKLGAHYGDHQIHNDVDLTENINEELFFSLLRVPRLLMWEGAVSRFVHANRVVSLYYYLHEYGYGRLITHLFRKYSPETKLIGFQHGPASERKMVYMAAKGELMLSGNSVTSFPIPDEVLAEDEHSAGIYRVAGYDRVSLMDRIYRLSYLHNVDRSKIDSSMVLIAPGLHDGKFLMRSIVKRITESEKMRYVLSPHPKADNRYICEFLHVKNLELASCSLGALLSKASKVFATYSSVAIEAYILGIEIELIDIPGRVNESPLLDAKFERAILQVRDKLNIETT